MALKADFIGEILDLRRWIEAELAAARRKQLQRLETELGGFVKPQRIAIEKAIVTATLGALSAFVKESWLQSADMAVLAAEIVKGGE